MNTDRSYIAQRILAGALAQCGMLGTSTSDEPFTLLQLLGNARTACVAKPAELHLLLSTVLAIAEDHAVGMISEMIAAKNSISEKGNEEREMKAIIAIQNRRISDLTTYFSSLDLRKVLEEIGLHHLLEQLMLAGITNKAKLQNVSQKEELLLPLGLLPHETVLLVEYFRSKAKRKK